MLWQSGGEDFVANLHDGFAKDAIRAMGIKGGNVVGRDAVLAAVA